MRLTLIPLALGLIVSSGVAMSDTACDLDYSGTVPTATGKGLPETTMCTKCRDLDQYPEDFSNHAWNYVNFGRASFTFDYYYDTLTRTGASTTMPIRTCNLYGQCANTFVTVFFKTAGAGISVGFLGIDLSIRTGRDRYVLVTHRPRGNNHDVTHMPEVVSQDELPVPLGSESDGHEVGACLANDGSEREATEVSTSGGDGSSGGGGGFVPPRPGYSGNILSPPGGGLNSGGSCWIFTVYVNGRIEGWYGRGC